MTAQLDITGSSENGYTPRQLADFQTAINSATALIVDPKTGEIVFQNNGDDTILQQVVAIISEAIQACDNAAAWASLMRDPATAVGALLSALVQLNGILRKEGSPTVINMTLTGTPSTLIPIGSLIAEATGSHAYSTYSDVVLDADGTATVYSVATETGTYIPQDGFVVMIQTPIPGWDEATNTGLVSRGTTAETDAELRRRQQISTNATSYRQIESIEAAVYNIEGVTFARSYQNRTLTKDERGIPGKTLAVVVVGGDEYKIASAIEIRTPLGISYDGNVARTIIGKDGEPLTVAFSRPTQILMWLRVTLSIVQDERIQIFPPNGVQLITDAIMNFVQNGHTDCEPLGNTGFPPGQDIILSYLYSPINSVGGVAVRKIETSVDNGLTWTDQDTIIAWNAIGVFDPSRIEIVFQDANQTPVAQTEKIQVAKVRKARKTKK